ncbi:hypothetical protein GCM10010293_30200 [Streptomyces griseoflavus]|nr:hypothetical protein GCM10010293_30200 [Streptomyces griseoflavus]
MRGTPPGSSGGATGAPHAQGYDGVVKRCARRQAGQRTGTLSGMAHSRVLEALPIVLRRAPLCPVVAPSPRTARTAVSVRAAASSAAAAAPAPLAGATAAVEVPGAAVGVTAG